MNASRHFYAIAGIVTLLTASGLATSRGHAVAAAAKPSDVNVTNTSANPVPTTAQGTTQVAGTVAVSSLPAVQMGDGSSIAINNPSGNPVLTRDVDTPIRTPIAITRGATLSDGTIGNNAPMYQVPAGQRLIITNCSLTVQLPSGENVPGGVLSDSSTFFYTIPTSSQGPYNSSVIFAGSVNGGYLPFGPGANIVVGVSRFPATGDGDLTASISGYLEPQP